MWFNLIYILFLLQCSSQIETGRNAHPPELEESETSAPLPQPSDAPNPSSSQQIPQVGSVMVASNRPSNCFAAGELPALVQEFCTGLASDSKNNFSKMLQHVCESHKISYLFADGCSWEGAGDLKKFLKVVEKTDLTAQNIADFYYMSVYSVTVSTSLATNMDNNNMAYLEPEKYNARYKLPGNSTIRNGIRNARGEIEYDLETVSSTSLAKFHGILQQVNLDGKLFITLDRSDKNLMTIKDHKMITFYFSLPNGSTRIVVINEKLFPTGGLHDLAFNLIYNLDVNRMEVILENARR